MDKNRFVKVRAVVLPLVAVVGAVCMVVWPLGHKTFCDGMSGVAGLVL